MSETTPETKVSSTPIPSDPRDAQIAKLQAQLAQATAKQPSKFKAGFTKFLAGIASAFTTPDAIKAEKSLAVIAITRILLAVGATEGAVKLVQAILSTAGVQ
jgi:hypothetical protein